MVHLRLNDPDTSRNPYINYVTSLPHYPDHQEAHKRLSQVAALFRPIMKKYGLQINSFEEYEPNPEFSGRNWNAGETVELVLRRRGTRMGEAGGGDGGGWLPFPLLCYVMSHELAHSFEMNHSSKHTEWTRKFVQECRELQNRGYYGDGLWSAGRRLSDAEWCQGSSELDALAVPSSLCGGAWRKKKRGQAAGVRKRKRQGTASTGTTRRRKGVPSLQTGAQTSRNTSLTAGKGRGYLSLPGSGSRVDGRDHLPKASAKSQDYKLDENTTFRKRANTNAARDLRAAATLKRIQALQSASQDGLVAKAEKGNVDKADVKLGSAELPSLGIFDPREDGEEQDVQTLQSDSGSATDAEEEGLYDSATEEEEDAKESPFSCGVAVEHDRKEDGPSALSPPQMMSSTETPAQRQRRMERFRQVREVEQSRGQTGAVVSSSKRGKAGGVSQMGRDEEEWQTAIKDVQRLGAHQRRADELQRAATAEIEEGKQNSPGKSGGMKDFTTLLKSEGTVRNKSLEGNSEGLPPTRTIPTSRSTAMVTKTSKRKDGQGQTLGDNNSGGVGRHNGSIGVSRLLSLRPHVQASDTESEDDVVCTGIKRVGG